MEEIRFINEMFRIIKGALSLDIDRVRNYTAFLAGKLDEVGEASAAGRLRQLLEESDHQLKPAGIRAARVLPVDSESRFPLLERVDLRTVREPPLVLGQDQQSVLNEFLSVAKSQAQLEAQGVNVSQSLLLYGPPGCGKSRLARAVARDLGLDLYVARLDGLISSFLGSTSKNIRGLFEFASNNPCVLFLDEFDAIAKLRADGQELGELKRVVNSFIQNLDTVGQQSIIVAATNHQDLLDPAVWRRFSYRIELGYPSPVQRQEMWAEFLKPLDFPKKEVAALIELSEGFSGSDIREVCTRLHRFRVLNRRDPGLTEAFAALRNLGLGEGEKRRFVSRLQGRPERAIATTLRNRSARIFSHAVLAELLGVSKATAYRWTTKKGTKNHG